LLLANASALGQIAVDGRPFDQPDLSKVVRRLSTEGAQITIYASKPSARLWTTPRDAVVFTAGTTPSMYFYPQRPTHDSVVLRSESDYFDLDHSRRVAVRVTGLEPNTTYYFRVNDSTELCRFRTAPPPGVFAPFQFTVGSDSQGPYDSVGDRELNKDRHTLGPRKEVNVAASFRFKITVESMRRNCAPDFAVHAGDIIEDARYTVQWQKELLGELKYYLTHAPLFPSMGNHEYHDPRFWRFFELPLGPEASGEDRAYYAFSWGDAHFIVLDFNGGWYEIRDADDYPEWAHYELTTEAKAALEGIVPPAALKRLQAAGAGSHTAEAFAAKLNAADHTDDQIRAVRTAALVVPADRPRFRVAVRNPRVGRISFGISAPPDLHARQWQWLEQELRKHRSKRFIFLFGHHPIHYNGVPRQPVVDLAHKYKVTATFAGHRHVYAHDTSKGVHFFQAGGLSDTVFSALAEKPAKTLVYHRHGPHYIVVNVEEGGATVLGVGRDNKVFERTVIPARTVR